MSNGMMSVPPRVAATPFGPLFASAQALTRYWHSLAESGACGDAELLALSHEAVNGVNAGAVGGALFVATMSQVSALLAQLKLAPVGTFLCAALAVVDMFNELLTGIMAMSASMVLDFAARSNAPGNPQL